MEQIHTANNETMPKTAVSVLVALRLIPNALFSNVGGVFADAYDRRNMMITLDLFGSFMPMLFILACQYKSIWGLYIATFCQMTIAAMYVPARSAMVPMLISNEGYLKKALTIDELTWSVMASVGASTGGVVTECFGILTCFLIDSCAYLMSALFIWRIKGIYSATSIEQSQEDPDLSTSQQDKNLDKKLQIISMRDAMNMTAAGFSYLKSEPWGAFVFLKGCAGLIYGAADILNVAFSEKGNGTNNLDDSSGRLGLIFASVGVGCFIGPIVSEQLTDMEKPSSLKSACIVSYALMGIGYLGLAQIEGFVSVCLFSSVRSAGSNILWIYSSLLLQVRDV